MTYIRQRRGTSNLNGEDMLLFEEMEGGAVIKQIAIDPLPNRRPGFTEDLYYGDKHYHLTVGFYPDFSRPAEAFLYGAKVGSEVDALLNDTMISLSKLLQSGADPAELEETYGRQSIVCAVVAAINELTASINKPA